MSALSAGSLRKEQSPEASWDHRGTYLSTHWGSYLYLLLSANPCGKESTANCSQLLPCPTIQPIARALSKWLESLPELPTHLLCLFKLYPFSQAYPKFPLFMKPAQEEPPSDLTHIACFHSRFLSWAPLLQAGSLFMDYYRKGRHSSWH